MTGREALRRAAGRLADAGRDDAERIALLLLQAAAGRDGAAFAGLLDLPVSDGEQAVFEEMAGRAVAGEPVQYILGRWDFYGYTFLTDRRALIPRPETELLVEAALRAIPRASAVRVFDAGCGTGCIGIAIKKRRPDASVTLGDVSAGALALARENAALQGADVAVVEADMRKRLPGGPFDVIVSNPPYVSTADMGALPPVVGKHEPTLALHGGEDGMDFLRALAMRAQDSLKPGGWLFAEVGYDQAGRAAALFEACGMAARALPDYSGILRVIEARKGT